MIADTYVVLDKSQSLGDPSEFIRKWIGHGFCV